MQACSHSDPERVQAMGNTLKSRPRSWFGRQNKQKAVGQSAHLTNLQRHVCSVCVCAVRRLQRAVVVPLSNNKVAAAEAHQSTHSAVEMRKVSISQHICIFCASRLTELAQMRLFRMCMRKGQSASATNCHNNNNNNNSRREATRRDDCVRCGARNAMRCNEDAAKVSHSLSTGHATTLLTWHLNSHNNNTNNNNKQRAEKDKGCRTRIRATNLHFTFVRPLFLFTSLAALNFILFMTPRCKRCTSII